MARVKKIKATNTETTRQAKKGAASGRRKTKNQPSSVADVQQTLNAKTSDTSTQPSPGPAKRPTARGRKMNVSRASTTESSPPTAQRQASVRGGRDKGKRGGASQRTKDATENSQVDTRTPQGAGVKRTQKMRGKDQEEAPSASTGVGPRKPKRHTGQRKPLDDEDYLERQLSAQSIAKWQTMSKTSLDFLHQIADSAISVVQNETSSSNYEAIQDHLNNLKQRLTTSFVSLKVPNRRQPNYREMEKHAHVLEAALVETSNQVECLDKEVRVQQELLERKEEELEKLEATEQQDHHDNSQDITKKLHPLLQDNRQDILGLPPLRQCRHGNTSSQFEDVRSSCQQEVVEMLRRWSQTQGEGAAEMTDFMDAVSAVQAALPL